MNTTQLQSTTNDTLVVESTVRRVLVEKRAGFDLEAQSLKKDLIESLHIDTIENIRVLNRYDVEDLSEEVFENAPGVAAGNVTGNAPGVFSGGMRAENGMRKKHRYRHGNRDLPDRLCYRKFRNHNK